MMLPMETCISQWNRDSLHLSLSSYFQIVTFFIQIQCNLSDILCYVEAEILASDLIDLGQVKACFLYCEIKAAAQPCHHVIAPDVFIFLAAHSAEIVAAVLWEAAFKLDRLPRGYRKLRFLNTSRALRNKLLGSIIRGLSRYNGEQALRRGRCTGT